MDGYLFFASTFFSSASRSVFGTSLPVACASEHTCWISVWFRRSSFAMLRSLNEVLTACADSSFVGATYVAHPAMIAKPPSTHIDFFDISLAPQRLIAGASIFAPLAFTPRNVIGSSDVGDRNPSSGQRCWRKQSYSRHCIVRSAPCDTR